MVFKVTSKNILIIFIFLLHTSVNAEPTGYYNKGALKKSVSIFSFIEKSNGKIKSLSPEKFQYGTKHMLSTISKISQWLIQKKKAPLLVGDISKKKGGKIAKHAGHQNGLGADIAYISKKRKSSGHRSNSFHNRFNEIFEIDNTELSKNFDVSLNYDLLRYISEKFDVFNILVGCKIFEELSREGQQNGKGAIKGLQGKPGHEDHFHLRLKCPKNAKNCISKWWKNPNKKKKIKSSCL